ncbi:SRPBCC domain-containing protein [Hyphobacterium marinum]|uniref:SRPBCC domain-containing protein n=1 Tax=Hyphobacterium marinum TaxID=3116574 RepID=A0ABU7LZG0_9PROT|nr:SRPBCC domain-containing protein [Hyphobacterium sp. Y6023]MEE2566947.1 SRPBCC domain-containing protein [Hyphobacterium sp. Y6023]
MGKIAPVEKTIEVDRDPQTAFEFFTTRFGDWWPKATHSVGADSHGIVPERVLMEPGVGGHIYEVLPDGREFIWGRITVWETGTRLVFSWQIDKPDEQATEVEVTFTRLESGRTRVQLTHRNWENDPRGSTLRDNYDEGWDPVVAAYADLAASA